MIDRKRKVLLKAKHLFIEKGFSATSVQDILTEANISKGTFYNYFSSKNECLMAILETSRKETMRKRDELLNGKNVANKSILAKQILVRLQVNCEQNLMPIFQAIYYSSDKDLKDFAKKYYLAEIHWLKERFIQVYGEDSVSFVTDCAVITHGMIQHMMHVIHISKEKEVNIEELIHFIIRKIDAIMKHAINNNDVFLKNSDHIFYPVITEYNTNKKRQLMIQLDKVLYRFDQNKHDEVHEYLKFLKNEVVKEKPRIYIMETIVRTLESICSEALTKDEQFLKEVIRNFQSFINTVKYDEGSSS